MSSRTRIPESISSFNDYITNTNTYQLGGLPITNAIRLGWTATNSLQWKDRKEAWEVLYAKYIDPAQSTSIVKADVKTAMKSFTHFAQPLLDIAAASPAAANADAGVFNFVLDRKKSSKPTSPLAQSITLDIKSIGGGEFKFKCRSRSDSGRASKPKGSDSVQLAVRFGNTAPLNAKDGTTKELFTKASFTFHAGDDNIGSKMYVFGRWYNTKYPKLAAPWGALVTILVG